MTALRPKHLVFCPPKKVIHRSQPRQPRQPQQSFDSINCGRGSKQRTDSDPTLGRLDIQIPASFKNWRKMWQLTRTRSTSRTEQMEPGKPGDDKGESAKQRQYPRPVLPLVRLSRRFCPRSPETRMAIATSLGPRSVGSASQIEPRLSRSRIPGSPIHLVTASKVASLTRTALAWGF